MTDMTSPPATAPFSLRLTREDRLRLEADAARYGRPGMSLGAYMRWRLLAEEGPSTKVPPRTRGRFPVRDHQALSAVLGKLGSTRLANNLNQLARAANLSALDVTPEVEADLRQACADVAAMRSMLVAALGLSAGPSMPEER